MKFAPLARRVMAVRNRVQRKVIHKIEHQITHQTPSARLGLTDVLKVISAQICSRVKTTIARLSRAMNNPRVCLHHKTLMDPGNFTL